MTGPWNLGNDVVDLSHPGTSGKARDRRFLSRVFTEEEQRSIHSSPDPDRAIWLHWAAKEAVFKSTSKALGAPPIFIHPRFEVFFSRLEPEGILGSPPPSAEMGPLRGIGRYDELRFQVQIQRSGTAIHAVSWKQAIDGIEPDFVQECRRSREETRGDPGDLRGAFSDLEWDCVTHRASALARVQARKAMASTLGLHEGAVQIRCTEGVPGRRIPRVWVEESELPIDLTLSHHGAFLAWAFLSP